MSSFIFRHYLNISETTMFSCNAAADEFSATELVCGILSTMKSRNQLMVWAQFSLSNKTWLSGFRACIALLFSRATAPVLTSGKEKKTVTVLVALVKSTRLSQFSLCKITNSATFHLLPRPRVVRKGPKCVTPVFCSNYLALFRQGSLPS